MTSSERDVPPCHKCGGTVFRVDIDVGDGVSRRGTLYCCSNPRCGVYERRVGAKVIAHGIVAR